VTVKPTDLAAISGSPQRFRSTGRDQPEDVEPRSGEIFVPPLGDRERDLIRV
jgi:hypothetical protein